MGLIEPLDLDAWRRWQASRHRLRRLRHRWTTSTPEQLVLTTFGDEPRLLVAIDSGSPTSNAALLEPLRHLKMSYAVLSAQASISVEHLESSTSQWLDDDNLPSALRSIRAVSSLGHYMRCGAVAHQWSQQLAVPYLVTQHGALTPFMAPLPPEAHLLAWSESDAQFWRSGRADGRHHVVGSQLLWRAGAGAATPGPAERDADLGNLTYLGQMHGAELPRDRLVRAAAAFCRRHDAIYRPHPSERDKLSRLAHASYERLGITVENGTPLAELANPVVSVFSTGVLEAACRGRQAWVDFPRPPAWLGEFWERYGMHRYGDSPTPAPEAPVVEPARQVAQVISGVVQ